MGNKNSRPKSLERELSLLLYYKLIIIRLGKLLLCNDLD